ncbi:glycosyltransferase family 87 protein [Halorhabdus amylolytica]|uniref:glycosyltransferase family 87 protein n=1 Tax=Halorhabdus amylolytica TaxID=2559573 RepID=UPI00145B06A6|nr:glycosyltransferase family 87 protein [Halorhabdus amylolytica]
MSSIPRQLWTYRRERPVFVIVSVVTIVTLLGWLPVEHHLREMGMGLPYTFNDFSAYTEALNRWLEGTQMYVPQDNGGYFGEYLYPPVTVLAFYPFKTTGFDTGAVLFGFTAIVLLWLGLEATIRTLGYRLRIWERLGVLVMLFSFQPVIRNFRWAQTATLLTALLAFAFYFQERAESKTSAYGDGEVSERTRSLYRYASGAFTTLGSSFKLFYATSGAHLLRDRKRFAGAMAAAAGLLVVSLAVFGVETNLQYLDVLTWGKGWGENKAMYAWDTAAAYRPMHAFGSLGLYLKILGILTVIGLTLATRTSDSRMARHVTFALGVAVVPLFAPKADSHDLVVLVVPAVILLAYELDRPDGYAWMPVLSVLLVHVHRYVIVFLTQPEGNFPGAALLYDFGPYLQPGMWGTFLLVGLAGYRVAEHAALPGPETIRDWFDR